mgnify:CR=1 FL=1
MSEPVLKMQGINRTYGEGKQALTILNDADFARALVRDRLRLRPKGRRALSAELARKGVAREVSDEVMDEIFAEMETSEAEVADRVAAGWLKRQPSKTRTALFEGPRSEAGAKAWRRGLGLSFVRAPQEWEHDPRSPIHVP